ncbi:carboxypeptidase-like regulatory domain-containing protein [Humisphaera borealis]|uniref:Carboxypeptidase regulatory-like domain-containing protein n=1 Tax=Humisphaera borealis TaxID=2807512 RepID=A0A7M2X0Z5_9BACT|nr:carboxypeptidase-like regulatory domain-containing protein [Humisphaera borealis]QOV91102.1 carboxypeptidase regulatory-like domain-containing protein [Humisphaera borealis]
MTEDDSDRPPPDPKTEKRRDSCAVGCIGVLAVLGVTFVLLWPYPQNHDFTFRGTVTDMNGQPISGATVTCLMKIDEDMFPLPIPFTGKPPRSENLTAVSDSSGRFAFNGRAREVRVHAYSKPHGWAVSEDMWGFDKTPVLTVTLKLDQRPGGSSVRMPVTRSAK